MKKEDVTINYGKVLVVSRCMRDRGARGMLESVAENIERRKRGCNDSSDVDEDNII